MISQNEIIIKDYLKNHMGLSEKRVLQELEGLKKYSDIVNEFAYYIQNSWNSNKTEWITIEGFSARKLIEQYSLSVLGAYNYLIYLCEDPNEALEFLTKGLPRE